MASGAGSRAIDAVDETSVLARRTDVGTVAVDAEAVLVDEAGGRAHALNPTGSLVWACLDGSDTLGAVADDLAAGFGAARDVVAGGVIALVRDLARLGLLAGFDAEAGAWPDAAPTRPADECGPDDVPTPASFDDRYLAVPPSG